MLVNLSPGSKFIRSNAEMPHNLADEHLWLVVRSNLVWPPPSLLRYLGRGWYIDNSIVLAFNHYWDWARHLCTTLRNTCKTTYGHWRRLHHYLWVLKTEHGRALKAAETYRVHMSSLWLRDQSYKLVHEAHESIVKNYNGGDWSQIIADETTWLRPGYSSGTSENSS